MTGWVADNAVARNIRYVLHVGDVVDRHADMGEWTEAQTAMNLLDGEVPYAMAVGNHDVDGFGVDANNRTATNFNLRFPRAKFACMPSFGGSQSPSTYDNTYHLFSAGGTDWMVLTLKWAPVAAELTWAAQLVAANPGRQVIIVTHDYLLGDGTRSAVGQQVWNAVAGVYPNVAMVLSGHRSVARRSSVGRNGNTVHEIMADYQNPSQRNPNGYLRVLEFDPRASTLSVRTYNPETGTSLTDPANQFTLSGISFPAGSAPSEPLVRQALVRASATSAHTENGAARALDGDCRTMWHNEFQPATPLPQSVTLDLQRVHDVRGLVYAPRNDHTQNGTVTAYTVATSLDGTSFQPAATGTWPDDRTLKRATWPVTEARYVRLTASAGHAGFAAAAELHVVYQPESLVAQALMKATATSANAEYPASLAVDGSPDTIWHTEWVRPAPLPQSITLDLGSSQQVRGLVYQPRLWAADNLSPNGIITRFQVQVSSDGVTFTTVATGSWADDRTTKGVRWATLPARYVRLQATAGRGGYASAAELDVVAGVAG
ncbi:discoidin domain-containing protein [Plantactinospora sp. B6F1]|uniref:discoidin domain-containing protein n=1 Tax=Plantactinospora sp. B6F1 TaxID=3158971 RepID=UPI0032D92543